MTKIRLTFILISALFFSFTPAEKVVRPTGQNVCLAPELDSETLFESRNTAVVFAPLSKQVKPVGSGAASNIFVRDYKMTTADGSINVVAVAEKIYAALGLDQDADFWTKRFNEEVRIMQDLTADPSTRQCSPVFYNARSNPKIEEFVIFMEYLDGFELFSKFEGEVDEILDLFLESVNKLSRVHAKGIVHHDICPANMMFRTTNSGVPEVRIIDFGLAGQLGNSTGVVGHLGYLPAEVLPFFVDGVWTSHKHVYSTKTDIYSLGVVFAELLVGDFRNEASAYKRHSNWDYSDPENVTVRGSDENAFSDLDSGEMVNVRELFLDGRLEKEHSQQARGRILKLFTEKMELMYPGYTGDKQMHDLYSLLCGMMHPDSDYRYDDLGAVMFELIKIKTDLLDRDFENQMLGSA